MSPLSAAKKQPDTRERILKAALKLFARKGIEGSSLRDITAEAGANLQAVDYHFGSKDDLVMAVLAQCAKPLIEKSIRELDALEKESGESLAIADIIRINIRPFLLLGNKDRDFLDFLGNMIGSGYYRKKKIRSQFLSIFAEMNIRFPQALLRAARGAARDEFLWRLIFIAVMLATLGLGQWIIKDLGELAGLDVSDENVEKQLEQFIISILNG